MDFARQIVRELKLNYGVIQAQVNGLSHEDSLIQLPFRGNCLNWVLGHLVDNRARMLRVAGIEPLWDNTEYAARYSRDTEPITDGAQALPFEEMLENLTKAQDHLLSHLKRMTAEDLAVIPEGDERDVGAQLAFLSWHETYHTGQTEYLRQLAGMDDKVI